MMVVKKPRFDPQLGERIVTVRMTVAELEALLSAANLGKEDESWFESHPDEVAAACDRGLDKAYDALIGRMNGRELCESCGVRAADPKLFGRLLHHYSKEPMQCCRECLEKMEVQDAQEDE